MKRSLTTVTAAAAIVLAACAKDSNANPAVSGTPTATSSATPITAVPVGAIRFTVAPTGNAARYRVREQLMGHDLPNDAVGETQQITGAITIDSAGRVIADQSRFVVGVAGLKSDKDRRDGYIRGRVLETDQYPSVELVPTALRALPAGFSATRAADMTAPITFEMLANLTVHGVTRPTTWRVSARQVGGRVTGSASSRFTFEEFNLTQPRVPVVLSVADTIALEYDFTLARESPQH